MEDTIPITHEEAFAIMLYSSQVRRGDFDRQLIFQEMKRVALSVYNPEKPSYSARLFRQRVDKMVHFITNYEGEFRLDEWQCKIGGNNALSSIFLAINKAVYNMANLHSLNSVEDCIPYLSK